MLFFEWFSRLPAALVFYAIDLNIIQSRRTKENDFHSQYLLNFIWRNWSLTETYARVYKQCIRVLFLLYGLKNCPKIIFDSFVNGEDFSVNQRDWIPFGFILHLHR